MSHIKVAFQLKVDEARLESKHKYMRILANQGKNHDAFPRVQYFVYTYYILQNVLAYRFQVLEPKRVVAVRRSYQFQNICRIPYE